MMKKTIWLLAVGCWLLAVGAQAQPDWVSGAGSVFKQGSNIRNDYAMKDTTYSLNIGIDSDPLSYNTSGNYGQYWHRDNTTGNTYWTYSSNSTGILAFQLIGDLDGTKTYAGFRNFGGDMRMWTGVSQNNTYINLSAAGVVTISALADGSLSSVSGVITSSSDARLKNLRGSFSAGLHAIKGIQPMRYTWNEKSGLNSRREYAGFVAQNVEYNIPEAVSVGKDGMKSLNITPILAAAINAINEQQRQIEKLQAEIRELKSYFQ